MVLNPLVQDEVIQRTIRPCCKWQQIISTPIKQFLKHENKRMKNNHQLKDECKMLLERIRKMLPESEKQKIEQLLRDILDVAKQMSSNNKVSPEDLKKTGEENHHLKQELQTAIETKSSVLKKLDRVEKEKGVLESRIEQITIQQSCLAQLVCEPLFSTVKAMLTFVEEYGDGGIRQWLSNNESNKKIDPMTQKILVAMNFALFLSKMNEAGVFEQKYKHNLLDGIFR
jgi:hypothetical protein